MSAIRLNTLVASEGSPVDLTVVLSAGLLLMLGLIMVTSASSEVAARNYGHPL